LSLEVTSKTGTHGRYLAISLAVFPFSLNTTSMPGRISTAFLERDDTMDSIAETGLGVKDRT